MRPPSDGIREPELTLPHRLAARQGGRRVLCLLRTASQASTYRRVHHGAPQAPNDGRLCPLDHLCDVHRPSRAETPRRRLQRPDARRVAHRAAKVCPRGQPQQQRVPPRGRVDTRAAQGAADGLARTLRDRGRQCRPDAAVGVDGVVELVPRCECGGAGNEDPGWVGRSGWRGSRAGHVAVAGGAGGRREGPAARPSGDGLQASRLRSARRSSRLAVAPPPDTRAPPSSVFLVRLFRVAFSPSLSVALSAVYRPS